MLMTFCRTPRGLEDVSMYPELFAELLRSGVWSEEDLRKVAGLNLLRVFNKVEKVRSGSLEFILSSESFTSLQLTTIFILCNAVSLNDARSQSGIRNKYQNTEYIT